MDEIEDQKREVTPLESEREKAAATVEHLSPESDETEIEINPTPIVVIPRKR